MGDDTEATTTTAIAAGSEPGPVSLEQWANQLGIGGKAVLTTSEAAAVLRVSERSLRDMIKAGTVPSLRLGRRLLVPVPMLLRSLLEEPKHG